MHAQIAASAQPGKWHEADVHSTDGSFPGMVVLVALLTVVAVSLFDLTAHIGSPLQPGSPQVYGVQTGPGPNFGVRFSLIAMQIGKSAHPGSPQVAVVHTGS